MTSIRAGDTFSIVRTQNTFAEKSAPDAAQALQRPAAADLFEEGPLPSLGYSPPKPTLEEQRTNALSQLYQHFELLDTAAGLGPQDGIIGRGDLQAAINHPNFPAELREACRFVLEDATFSQYNIFDKGDVAAALGTQKAPSFEERLKNALGQLHQHFECVAAAGGDNQHIRLEGLQAAVGDSSLPAELREACQFLLESPGLGQYNGASKSDVTAALGALSKATGTAEIVETGLGAEVDALVALSPTLQNALRRLLDTGLTIQYGEMGRSGPTFIEISDYSKRKGPAYIVGELAWGAGFNWEKIDQPNESSEFPFSPGIFFAIEVRREILANGGPDTGLDRQAGDASYNAIYEQYLLDGDLIAGYKALHALLFNL